MIIIKRNGEEVNFETQKIVNAITKANSECGHNKLTEEDIINISDNVVKKIEYVSHIVSVEEVQDLVEEALFNSGNFTITKKYITYRYDRALIRKSNSTDATILSITECTNQLTKEENSNKNPIIHSVQRDYIAGEVSKDLTNRELVPKHIMDAHSESVIHFHDSDYFIQHMHNCSLVNLEDMLNNGTVISGKLIEKPNRFSTACNIATQCIAQVASQQYGGQSISLSHLAPFVNSSRMKLRKEVKEELASVCINLSEEKINQIAEMRVMRDIEKGVQIIQYQVITLMTTNGQSPFITMFMYLNEVKDPQTKADLALVIEEVLKQRIIGVKNEVGVYVTPAFPKLIYVLQEDNIKEGTEYWDLTVLAAQCTTKRLVPDYISEKKMLEMKVDKNGDGNCYPCMGCRSFLTPYLDAYNNPKYYGRFNQGVVTINLVDVACTSKQDEDVFWSLFEERLELCKEALMIRHKRLLGTTSDVAPILWQYGALARLKKGEKIDKLLFDGYSTISLGFAGLYECVKYMTGMSHTDANGGKEFAIRVMKKMNDKCNEWKAAEKIDFSVYGTPLESTTYKFAKSLQNKFGVIEGVTDKNYITNSYHVHVTEKIDAFSKLKFESEFQDLSPGGAISYIETPDLKDNITVALEVIKYIYNHILYAELNGKSDYCQNCGYEGEILIVKENGKLIWECPNCGNRDQDTMNIARRTCGYIGENYWNQGRTGDINDRVLHL